MVQIIVEYGPGLYLISCISLVFHVLSATGRMTTQKLSKSRRACDATEAVENVINIFNKSCCCKASVVYICDLKRILQTCILFVTYSFIKEQ